MMIAISSTVKNAVQEHLKQLWDIIDAGEPIVKVILWLRKSGHKSMSDWCAIECADAIERNEREYMSTVGKETGPL